MKTKAKWWVNKEDYIRCELCPQLCSIHDGNIGFCGVRKNEGNELFTLNYGEFSSKALDPIEKKPLYRFHAGSKIYSVGSIGCNLGCAFCQNWQISHPKELHDDEKADEVIEKMTKYLSIEDLVAEANNTRIYGNIGVAFTYNEPFMSYEYLLDACKAIKEESLFNVIVTNGYINPKPLAELLPYIDALNIDLKGFREEVYLELDGHLTPVKKTIKTAVASAHVELTCLLVPGLNDDKQQINDMVDWIASIDSSLPLHFSRYFPAHHYHEEPTPIETLEMAETIAKEKLEFVYLGNV